MNKKTLKTEETKKKILNSALVVFSNLGIEGASIEKIANTANVNKALIYRHFGDKTKLFNSLFKKIIEERDNLILEKELNESLDIKRLYELTKKNKNMLKFMFHVEQENIIEVEREKQVKYYNALSAKILKLMKISKTEAKFYLLLINSTIIFPVLFPQITRMILGKASLEKYFGFVQKLK